MNDRYKGVSVWIPTPTGTQMSVRISTRSLEVLRACKAGEVTISVTGAPMHGGVVVASSLRALRDRQLITRDGTAFPVTADGEAVLREVDS